MRTWRSHACWADSRIEYSGYGRYEKAILGKRVSKMNEMDTLTALSSAIRDIIGQVP
jgi:hypothetical protein